MTTPEVANMFSVTTGTVRGWINNGRLPAKMVNGYNRIKKSDAAALAHRMYGTD